MKVAEKTRDAGRNRDAGGHHTKPQNVDWSLLSPQGRVLFYVALCPDSKVQDLARALGQTERGVWGIVRQLRRSGMLRVRKEHKRHRYSVNLDAPLFHPTIKGITLRPFLGELAERARRRRPPVCAEETASAQ